MQWEIYACNANTVIERNKYLRCKDKSWEESDHLCLCGQKQASKSMESNIYEQGAGMPISRGLGEFHETLFQVAYYSLAWLTQSPQYCCPPWGVGLQCLFPQVSPSSLTYVLCRVHLLLHGLEVVNVPIFQLGKKKSPGASLAHLTCAFLHWPMASLFLYWELRMSNTPSLLCLTLLYVQCIA